MENITFGKYEKAHVCNLKKFKVLGGLNDEHMIELFEGSVHFKYSIDVVEFHHRSVVKVSCL